MMNALLDAIQFPSDLRKLTPDQLPKLAKELREFIIDIVAAKQGHLGASLGVVELTIALHYLFDTPNDLLIWDVGHQAYGHKILTGRKAIFDTNRQLHGISGFPNITESTYDAFGVGHSSTSISAALGMAIASSLKEDSEKHHIAVIGDASIASGMAFEALNHAGVSDANLLIILNDNAIGIDPSVGALKEYLTKVKTDKSLAKNNIIRALNFDYSGPIDGHDLDGLLKELSRLKNKKGPKFLHINTIKGKGLDLAEKDQVKYHAPGKFDAKTGKLVPKSTEVTPPKYQDVFGKTIVELASKNEKIIGITPAMLTGSSLKLMLEKFPKRTFDVGIAEQHAVTFSAGIAAAGKRPFCSIYSSFAQRAYDQIIHDVALQNIPVVLCIDRAGLVGADGPTHHGSFDIAYLNAIPNLTIISPMDEHELRNAMYWAVDFTDGPVVIRYPRGLGSKTKYKNEIQPLKIGTSRILQKGDQIGIISIGEIGIEVQKAIDKSGIHRHIYHIDARFVKPIDNNEVLNMLQTFDHIITVEESCLIGGFGQQIKTIAQDYNYTGKITSLGLPDQFIEQGTREELRAKYNLDKDGICQLIQAIISKK